MKVSLRRIRFRRGRTVSADPVAPDATAAADPTQSPTEPVTEVAPPAEPLPAGMAPEDAVPTRATFRTRGRLRRRMRYLRRVRELGFRDLGGLAFDLHRFGRRNDELVLGKLQALDAVDRELRAIERVLDERRDILELREPGIAACPRCGALHGSDARFCPSCGTQLSGPLAIAEVGGGTAAQVASGPEPANQPAPVGDPLSTALGGEPVAPPPAAGGAELTAVEPAPAEPAPAEPTPAERPAAEEQPTVAIPSIRREVDDSSPPTP